MATADQFRERAIDNEALAKHLGGAAAKRWQTWVVTTLFYTALQEVNAFLLEKENIQVLLHAHRNAALAKYGDISDPYMRLYGWSRNARYDHYVTGRRLNDSVLLLAKVRLAIEVELAGAA